MTQLIVIVNRLNKRRELPRKLTDKNGIVGVVNRGFTFVGEPVEVSDPSLGKWYRDRDNNFYWGGGLRLVQQGSGEIMPEPAVPDNSALENRIITPLIKKTIEQVINVFETGSAEGNYAALVRLKDFSDPETQSRIVQVTYGRSQTTEFGHLKALVQDYVNSNGTKADELRPYLDRIGKKPSLATDDAFCRVLIDAGRNDPIMKTCQDHLFDAKYYLPAFSWFHENGFTFPLSLLVIYDSTIHSGRILAFLRKKFSTAVPVSGGDEKEWIVNYVQARHNWLAHHTDSLLRKTVYRTACFQEQIEHNNWNLSQKINAHGVVIG